jgi:hypothetical protein
MMSPHSLREPGIVTRAKAQRTVIRRMLMGPQDAPVE